VLCRALLNLSRLTLLIFGLKAESSAVCTLSAVSRILFKSLTASDVSLVIPEAALIEIKSSDVRFFNS